MLTGKEIYNQVIAGNIVIDPFNEKNINPNSYNVTLSDELLVYDSRIHKLDMKGEMSENILALRPSRTFIPESGLMLYPNCFYLAKTVERTHTDKFIPMLSGRSSVGRLGISIHATAGFGDIGFNGHWTLEIFVQIPVVIYPNVHIGQVYFTEPTGETAQLYRSKYQDNSGIQESMMWKDFK